MKKEEKTEKITKGSIVTSSGEEGYGDYNSYVVTYLYGFLKTELLLILLFKDWEMNVLFSDRDEDMKMSDFYNEALICNFLKIGEE